MTPTPTPLERFASVIRIADGNHDLGAASLAEAIIDLLPEFALRLVPANEPDQWTAIEADPEAVARIDRGLADLAAGKRVEFEPDPGLRAALEALPRYEMAEYATDEPYPNPTGSILYRDDVLAALATPVPAPEPLDVEVLYRAMVSLDTMYPGAFNIIAISEPDTKPVAELLSSEYARLLAARSTEEQALRVVHSCNRRS